MTQHNLKDTIAGLRHLHENINVPLIELLRPWMIITGLDFKDGVHLTADELVQKLLRVYVKLGDSLDLLDEDQLREAACRCFKKVTVYGELVEDAGIVLKHGQDIEWDGNTWIFISDPKLRMRETTKVYAHALEAVKQRLEI
jgi:hypothetical protein